MVLAIAGLPPSGQTPGGGQEQGSSSPGGMGGGGMGGGSDSVSSAVPSRQNTQTLYRLDASDVNQGEPSANWG